METHANHVLIGAFTLVGLALLLIIGLWSAQYASDAAWSEFEVIFDHPVSGLSVGSTVQYNGINMGSVRDLRLAPDNPSRVIALIRLEADAPVREDTIARLTVSGLTGVAFIQLRGGSPQSPPLRRDSKGGPPRIYAEESALQRLIESSEDIASMASEVMLRLLEFLSADNAERVSQTLDNIDRLSETLLAEGELISQTIHNLHQGSQRVDELVAGSADVVRELSSVLSQVESELIAELPEITDDLSLTLRSLASASERIDQLLADNEAAFNALGSDVITPLGPAVQEIRQLVRELSRLATRFERHPTRFLLGADQPEEYEPR